MLDQRQIVTPTSRSTNNTEVMRRTLQVIIGMLVKMMIGMLVKMMRRNVVQVVVILSVRGLFLNELWVNNYNYKALSEHGKEHFCAGAGFHPLHTEQRKMRFFFTTGTFGRRSSAGLTSGAVSFLEL